MGLCLSVLFNPDYPEHLWIFPGSDSRLFTFIRG